MSRTELNSELLDRQDGTLLIRITESLLLVWLRHNDNFDERRDELI